MDKKIQVIREDVKQAKNEAKKYIQFPVAEVSYLLQQIDDVDQSKFNILAARDNERNLKEQARKERDELFESISVLKQQMIEQRNYSSRLKEQIEIKDKALAFYADKNNHHWGVDEGTIGEVIESEVMMDYGELARAALKGEDTKS
ncbi:hypothetical protein D1872_54130 [compost metagenome]